MHAFASLPLYAFPLCMLVAAISDIRKLIIPNTVSLFLILAFFVSFAVSGLEYQVLLNHLMAGAGMLVVGFALFGFGFCGAGDSKLLAVAALWLGWPMFGHALIYIALFGGVLSVLIVLSRLVVRWFPRLSMIFPPAARLAAADELVAPYGVAIAAGSIVAFPSSGLFQAVII